MIFCNCSRIMTCKTKKFYKLVHFYNTRTLMYWNTSFTYITDVLYTSIIATIETLNPVNVNFTKN